MSREMMIIFVYDTSNEHEKEVDPVEAVMYFHPTWVSRTQRHALAGQLMGVHHFLTTNFSSPKMISLQGGKFRMKKFGRYVLAVGTDRNIQDWILERRSNCLESILSFFHCDLETISRSLNNDRNKITEKLHEMLETYLPILQYSSNVLFNMPKMKPSTIVNNVFLESIQILRFCQEAPGTLGGAIFFNNKVVATQLSAELTKHLVMTDPHRIRNPADRIATDFHLPLGVQLLKVFIRCELRQELAEDLSCRSHITHFDTSTRKSNKNIPTSVMKRDTSRIFTVHEECEAENCMNVKTLTSEQLPSQSIVKKFGHRESKPKSQNSLTPSVCSTPLRDVNRVLHGTVVSICRANGEPERQEVPETVLNNHDDIPDIVKEALRCKRLNKLMKRMENMLGIKMNGGIIGNKSSSLLNLVQMEEWLRIHSKYKYSLNSGQLKGSTGKKKFNTITDPCYPVFKQNGCPVSQSFHGHEISLHNLALDEKRTRNFPEDYVNSFGTMVPNLQIYSESEGSQFDEFDTFMKLDEVEAQIDSLDMQTDGKEYREIHRRSMSLPLKRLNAPDSNDYRRECIECVPFDIQLKQKLLLTPLMSKLSLLAIEEKKSDYHNEEVSPSKIWDLPTLSRKVEIDYMTEGVARKVETSISNGNDFWFDEKQDVIKKNSLNKAELFICGQFDMVLVMLMEDGTANNPDLIHNLWELCMKHFGRLGSQLQLCSDPLPSSGNEELYNILSIDPHWDTLHRSGLWGVADLDIVSSLHYRLTQSSNLTDIIVRSDDSVIYGSRSGRSEVFYQQAVQSNTSGSLPTPADLMGIVPLRARRRLEQDHGIVIL